LENPFSLALFVAPFSASSLFLVKLILGLDFLFAGFLVTPVYKESGETMKEILLRLMRADLERA